MSHCIQHKGILHNRNTSQMTEESAREKSKRSLLMGNEDGKRFSISSASGLTLIWGNIIIMCSTSRLRHQASPKVRRENVCFKARRALQRIDDDVNSIHCV